MEIHTYPILRPKSNQFFDEISSLIAFLAWTEIYVQRLISIEYFANHEDYFNMLEEIQLETSVDIGTLDSNLSTNKPTLQRYHLFTSQQYNN